MSETHLPTPNPLFLHVVSFVLRIVAVLFFRLSCHRNHDQLAQLRAQNRPVIIVFNHTSHLDVPAIALCIGVPMMRRMIMPGKKELFAHPAGAWFMRQGGAIPLDRDVGDASTTRVLLRALQANRFVLISPEGTRSFDGTLQAFKSGFVRLAHRTKALVLPVAISGAFQAFPRTAKLPRPGKVAVRVGAPIDIADCLPHKPTHADYEAAAELVRDRVKALLRGETAARRAHQREV